MKLKPNEVLLIQGGLGRFDRVTAVFTDPDTANAYMASATGEAVIAVFDNIIFLASTSDFGLPLPTFIPQSTTP